MQAYKLLSITLFATLLASGAMAEEAKTSSLSPEQKKEVEGIVRDMLNREPEMIESSLRASLDKKQKEARDEANKAVKGAHKALYEDSEDPIIGNPKGTVTMVVFMDPYCGYCRKFQPLLHKAVKEHKDLKIIYKALPVLGPESKKAAEEELAANCMGRFQDYHEAVYESSVHSRKERMELAEKNNIDTKTLKAGVASNKVDKHLERNAQLASKLGIHGTPAFIIGEELFPGYMDKEQLDDLIKAASKKQG